MAIGHPLADQSFNFNTNYNITLDLSGWSKSTIQTVAPMTGSIFVYGSNDANALLGVRQGNASLATNFSPVLVTNLATGTTTGTISGAGLFRYDVDAQFLRLQGSPAAAGTSVYRLELFHSKID